MDPWNRHRARGLPGDLGFPQNWGYRFGGPHKKDCSILGSKIWVPLNFGKLPFGFWVYGLGFSASGAGFGGLGFGMKGRGRRAWGLGFGIEIS